MTGTVTVTEALTRIHDSAKKSSKRKEIDCSRMPVGEAVRQGDVYIIRLSDFLHIQERIDTLVKQASPAQVKVFEKTFLENAPHYETWEGSRHHIDAPTRYDLVALREIRDTFADSLGKMGVRTLLTDFLMKLYENARRNNPDLNLPAVPTNMVLTPQEWHLRHKEHGDFTFPMGAFAVTRQMDLQTQRYVID